MPKMEPPSQGKPRTYRIRRSQHLGYGFIAGYEYPTMVKSIQSDGPSFERLLPGDVIMTVNGIDVEQSSREQIIRMIQLSKDEIEIKVRQPTYEEIIRAKNLADPKFYMFNKSDDQQHADRASSCNTQRLLSSPSNVYTSMNRLITSVTDLQERPTPNMSSAQDLKSNNRLILKQRADDNLNLIRGSTNRTMLTSGTNTLGRIPKNNLSRYGRHSPLPPRCKSSMSAVQADRNSVEEDEDIPMLKRSNTMRPLRPPAKVMEIFEVVIRIFFEDGHTRVLNYNQNTTVGVILETLNNRLVGSSLYSQKIKKYFGLALMVNCEDNSREQQMTKRKLYLLDENYSIMKIRQLPYAPRLRILYRMLYPPADVCKLYAQDKVAFEYLYKQSCNDLKLERLSPELDSDNALKLGALHLVEYVFSNFPRQHGNSKDPKMYLKLIKKSPGIEHFVPLSMIETTIDKKGKKVVTNHKRLRSKMCEQLKTNFLEFDFEPPKVKATTNLNRYTSTSFHELSLPELQSSPNDYVKLIFLNYLSQFPCYGNTRHSSRTSTSPMDQTSLGDCSSSIESVPRTSDSSPLLRPDYNNHSRVEHVNGNTISRIAQMNSIRSLSSSLQPTNSATNCHAIDRVDIAQTPSIESLSSITFNMHNSPSPQQVAFQDPQQNENQDVEYLHRNNTIEPLPMPRQQSNTNRSHDCNSIDKIYNQRYMPSARPLDELLESAILRPPPISYGLTCGIVSNRPNILTPILTDSDLEGLKVPPPPRLETR